MKSNIIVCGDLHGDWGKLNTLINTHEPKIILQCGDFGYWPGMALRKPVLYGQQKPWELQGVKYKDTFVLWCDGNHEDHWYLKDNPTLIDYGNVHYQRRGSVQVLPNGMTVMFIGGADSIDKCWRTLGIDWFPEEVINQEDLDRCLAFEGNVDIVISHTCPMEFDVKSNEGSEGKYNDPSRVALSRVLEKFKPDLFYFGHWHKAQSGKHLNTRWQCMDYPGHGGKWWTYL